jgi:hypothetical protein
LPFNEVVILTARHWVLSGISLYVQVYDPCGAATVESITGPFDELSEHLVGIPLEEFLLQNKDKKITVKDAHNEKIIESPFSFYYQPDTSELRDIRNKMGLDDIVKGAQSEIDIMIRLRNWARTQFNRKDFQKKIDPFNSLNIWLKKQRNHEKRNKKQDEYYPCHFFPLFYSQMLLSMGFNVRIVGIYDRVYGTPHGFTEVWSNQYGKWVSMDPDLNLHYTKNDIPLNMMEVHLLRYMREPGLVVHQIIVEPGVQPLESAKDMLNYHKYIRLADLRNDWLTNTYFKGHPKRSDLSTLFFEDKREERFWSLYPRTENPADMYWTLNQAEIYVDEKKYESGKINFIIKSVTPNFSHFVIVNNKKSIKWNSSFYTWLLNDGINRLTVKPVNTFGVEGVESWVELQYKKDL